MRHFLSNGLANGRTQVSPAYDLEKLVQEGAAAYFEQSALDLDKNSDRLAAAVETVLNRIHRQKRVRSV